MASRKLPAFQFYPGDWRKDPGIQCLSFHDRGVWFECLCLMHESEERGRLLLNGRPMPDSALARILGIDEPALKNTLETLLGYGVASRGEDGTLINRRMVRDEIERERQVEFGKLGGNPALGVNYNKPGFVYAIQRASDGAIKIGISEQPNKRLYKLRYQHRGDALDLLATVHVDDMGKAEAELHAKYRHRSPAGEWFALNPAEKDELLFTLKGKPASTLKGKAKGDSKGKPRSSSSSSSSSSNEDSAGANAPAGGQGSFLDDGALKDSATDSTATQTLEQQKKTLRAALVERFGVTPDDAAQNTAIKWLLETGGYTPEQCLACLDFQKANWKSGRISWLSVKNHIGSWLATQANPEPPKREERKTAADHNKGGTGKVVV